MPATPGCPKHRSEVYIAGTQPVGACPLHGGRPHVTTVTGWDTQPAPKPPPELPRIRRRVSPAPDRDGQVQPGWRARPARCPAGCCRMPPRRPRPRPQKTG